MREPEPGGRFDSRYRNGMRCLGGLPVIDPSVGIKHRRQSREVIKSNGRPSPRSLAGAGSSLHVFTTFNSVTGC